MGEFFRKLFGGLPSEKEAVILDLLLSGELYGGEIADRSEGQIGRGTLYVTLGRMSDKGYVTSRTVEKPEGAIGPARRYYKLTAEGRAALDQLGLLQGIAERGGR